jgi:carbonic anhydrase/acetyltransferase-like protein (isoleucine patch superfamily)
VREAARVGSKTKLRRWCVLDGEVVVGEHQFLGDYVVIDSRTAIGHGGALHQGTRIGGQCVIGDGVIVGAQAQIGSSVMIGIGATIGEYGLIHDNAAVGDGARVADHALIDREVVYEAGGWLYVVATGYARAPWLTAVWSRRHSLRLWCGWASGFRTALPPELEPGTQGGRPATDFIREMYGHDSQVPTDDLRYLIETVFRHPCLAPTIRAAASG